MPHKQLFYYTMIADAMQLSKIDSGADFTLQSAAPGGGKACRFAATCPAYPRENQQKRAKNESIFLSNCKNYLRMRQRNEKPKKICASEMLRAWGGAPRKIYDFSKNRRKTAGFLSVLSAKRFQQRKAGWLGTKKALKKFFCGRVKILQEAYRQRFIFELQYKWSRNRAVSSTKHFFEGGTHKWVSMTSL